MAKCPQALNSSWLNFNFVENLSHLTCQSSPWGELARFAAGLPMGNRALDGAAHQGTVCAVPGRMLYWVSGPNQPARIEGCSRHLVQRLSRRQVVGGSKMHLEWSAGFSLLSILSRYKQKNDLPGPILPARLDI
jgi:hypothetical protein